MSGNDDLFVSTTTNVYNVRNKNKAREAIKRQTEEFLAKGGKVNKFGILMRNSTVLTHKQLEYLRNSLEKGHGIEAIAFHLGVSAKELEQSQAFKNISRVVK